MSLMANFDFIAEISIPTLLNFIKRDVMIGNSSLNPPCEITIFSNQGIADFIITDIQLDLNPDQDLNPNDKLKIIMLFYDSSVNISNSNIVVSPLDGTMEIIAPIQLSQSDNDPPKQVISIDMTNAVASIILSENSETVIYQKLGPLTASLKSELQKGIQTYVNNIGLMKLNSPEFNVVPGADGQIKTPIRFEKLEVHCIIDPASKQGLALGIFGIFLLSNHNNGDHTQKTSTSIIPGHDICISMSPQTFHFFSFCTSLKGQLDPQNKMSVNDMPLSCGLVNNFEKDGATIKQIVDTLGQDHININGIVKKSGFCYDATCTFHTEITLSVNDTTIVATLGDPDVCTNVDIPWYCQLASITVFGIMGLVIDAIVSPLISNMANDIAKASLKDFLQGQSTDESGGFSNISFDNISVIPDGITLNGFLPIQLPIPPPRSIQLDGSVVTISQQVISSGNFILLEGCAAGSYPYNEYAQEQKGTYGVSSHLMGHPLSFEWHLTNEFGDDLVLNGVDQVLNIRVQCSYPLPLPGGISMVKQVTITYTVHDDKIFIQNVPSDGTYGLMLSVKVTDPIGNVLWDYATVQFFGDIIIVGGDLYKKALICHDRLRYSKLRSLPKWVPVNYPPAEKIRELISVLITSKLSEAQEMLSVIKLVHGNSFHRALFENIFHSMKNKSIRKNMSKKYTVRR